ncbi:serine hydrolase domain-containing protein [Ekhidna sp.]|uniref:serine hydrolase domain-containing protein n=1 Tax=Ekhidna sp. TaxID=2608089 RepID=UPI00329683E1
MTNKITTFFLSILFLLTSCSESIHSPHELLEEYAENGRRKINSPFTGAVLIAKDGEVAFKHAYGYSDRENEIPNQIDTRFPIGSITKQFTSMLVMQMVGNGTIELSDPLSQHLSYLPESFADQFTIHQLLSHTSGLPHYPGLFRSVINSDEFAETAYTPKELALLVSKVDLIDEPGTTFHYSSLGYMLLGALLEEVSGLSYASLLELKITQPLGMGNTGFATNAYIKEETAKGYAFVEDETFMMLFKKYGGEFENVKFRDQSNKYSTGGMHSTVEDLFVWSEAIKNNTLLNQSLTEQMLTANKQGYCYGWIKNWDELIERNTNARMITHGGALFGHRSSITLFKDGTTIIFLANVNPIKDTELIHQLYLATHQLPDTFRMKGYPDRSSLKVFEGAGGISAFNHYFNTLSDLSGYDVLPSESSITHLMYLYGEVGNVKKVDSIKLAYFEDYDPSEGNINRLAYGLLEDNCELAVDFFRENAARNPNSPNVWDSLGEGLLACGTKSEAIQYFEKAVELAREQNDLSLEVFEKNLSKARS